MAEGNNPCGKGLESCCGLSAEWFCLAIALSCCMVGLFYMTDEAEEQKNDLTLPSVCYRKSCCEAVTMLLTLGFTPAAVLPGHARGYIDQHLLWTRALSVPLPCTSIIKPGFKITVMFSDCKLVQ